MPINLNSSQSASLALAEAMRGDDEAVTAEAWQTFMQVVADETASQYTTAIQSNDSRILAERGFRQLTSEENKWYQKFISALSDTNPKQAFAEIIGSSEEADIMPATIIEDVFKYLVDTRPLLKAVNPQYVGYIAKWILNDHTVQKAVWGEITAAITAEISSGFKVIDVTQNKLSAFAAVERGMLDLGPVFLDGYIRTVLAEAWAYGLEYGIVKGTGLHEPIGLVRDIHEGVTVSTTTGYPLKSKVEVLDFTPINYGALVAQLAENEAGKGKNVDFLNGGSLVLLVNNNDWLTKVMPATTVLNGMGEFSRNVYPVPTQTIISNCLADGEAVLALLDEYGLFVGLGRNGAIEYSDEYNFVQDKRFFKIVSYGAGQALDNTSALFLNISNLAPTYLTVRQVSETLSDDVVVTGFCIPGQTGDSTIDATNHTVAIAVPFETVLTALKPIVSISTGATVSPASGAAADFVDGVAKTYTVTAEDGSTQQAWAVTITVAPDPAA